jgi:DNA-binding response OmpR family regulator
MNELPAILVVEDDHLIQSVVEEALKEGGFEITVASSAGKLSNCSTVPAANIGRSSPT